MTPEPEITEEEFKKYLDPQASYIPAAFSDPMEMLEALFVGTDSVFIKPYSWQKDELLRHSNTPCSNKQPFRHCISANNGAGKDSMFNAPVSVFQCLCKIRSRTIITTSSYPQLVNQTEAYIRTIASQANNIFQSRGVERAFHIKKEHIACSLTGSEIVLFVTDEAGRAEGYHPFPDYPDGEVTIILNEAKSVPDIIFEALSRCTFSRWYEISSPGGMTGKHHKHIKDARNSNNEHPKKYDPKFFYFRRITSYDCPHHISIEKIESDKLEYGENSAIFRSKHLALFTSLEEQVVINKESVEQAILFPSKVIQLGIGRRAGLDLAKGGDENSLCIVEENEIIGLETFRAFDTAEVTIPVLIDMFKKWKLEGDNIYADDGGVGGPIIDGLRLAKYNINRILMQSPPSQKGGYANLGAELWFRFSQILPYIIFGKTPNQKLIDQLSSRYYKQQATTGKIVLEAKADARTKGHGSPDRADSLVLAYTGISVHLFLEKLGLEKSTVNVIRKLLSVQEALDISGKNKLNLPNDINRLSLPRVVEEMRKTETLPQKRINNFGRLLRSLY